MPPVPTPTAPARAPVSPPAVRTVVDLLKRCVVEAPDAYALDGEALRLTYRELDARSDSVARGLRRRGVGRGSRVGLLTERTPDRVVALFGVLKSGAAYLPLDPRYPTDRLLFMAGDSGIEAIVSTASLSLDLGSRVSPIGLEDLYADGIERRPLEPASSDAAYLIYTSGSTGVPKGVLVEHGALTNYVLWSMRHFELGRSDRVLQFAPFSFDTAGEEIYPTLATGATLVLRRGGPSTAEAFWRDAERDALTVVNLPTAFWHELVDAEIPAPPSVRLVIIGGEPADPERWHRWDRLYHERAHRPRLVNTYGATETAMVSCCSDLAEIGGRLPIGPPIDGVSAHVLDPHGDPVAPGAVGELFVGGRGLARGYWNRPELTAERFLPDPFSVEPGARLYRTGDLARALPDGSLECLGRTDRQVKLRGFRIEPGEVESVLRRHPSVRDAAVTVSRGRLVAHLVASGAGPLLREEIRAFVATHLPSHMVPGIVHELEALPMTPSGKLDRLALPEPRVEAPLAGESMPRTQVETMLAAIWEEVLEAGPVGHGASFLDLGGDSLRAMQVASRVRGTFGVELEVATLFSLRTLGALAGEIERATASESITPPIRPSARKRELPLSFAQQRLWFLSELQPETTAYHMVYGYALRGSLDPSALERALGEIVRRHEALRTTFAGGGGRPVQRVRSWESARPRLRVQAVSSFEEARRLFREEAERRFDLQEGPLFRASLFRIDDETHVVVLAFHHIVTDGWSMEVFFRELETLYAADRQHLEAPLSEPALQYGDFALWQREWLPREDLERQLDYWKRELDSLPRLELQTDFPRPSLPASRGRTHRFHLSRRAKERALAVAASERATLFQCLCAAFVVLLHRMTSSREIVIGSPIANRSRPELEGLIGFFVNSWTLRAAIPDEARFRDVLRLVRDKAFAAYAHQDLPFEKLVEELSPERDTSRHPLFQVSFALQNAEKSELALPGLVAEPLFLDRQGARLDLEVHLWERSGGLAGEILYDEALFEEASIRSLSRRLRSLLEHFVQNPESLVADTPLTSAAERRRVLLSWNDTTRELEGELLHELFERQADRSPERTAVVFGSESLTFRELDGRANAFALQLRRLGVGPESHVGILMERSADLVIALLGVLKAGGAYLPLDPSYPERRLLDILEDSDPRVVVAGPGRRLPGRFAVAHPNAGETAGRIEARAHGESPAYLLYTSGSTGRPKGVLVPHRAISNHMAWMRRALALAPDDRVLQKTPVGFDASVWEFWAPLVEGATLVMAPPGIHRDPEALIRCLLEEEITILQVVPTLLDSLLDEGRLQRCRRLRRVLCGGEELRSELALRFFESGLGAELVNVYGPTEATIHTSFARVSPCDRARRSAPIGRPIDNVRVYVLDDELAPAPPGIPGELYVGGLALARGYVRAPELTAERFVPDPFGAQPGARLYRTGDRVRFLEDGRLEFLGRLDDQVKLRGHRIELGEVEAVLGRHPEVGKVVASVEGGSLAAHVVRAPLEDPADGARDSFLCEERVRDWRVFYEHLYGRDETPSDPAFDTVGWTSSFTGEPLPEEDLRRWLQETVSRILELEPRRVLEIGCGTGLVLFRVAPHCTSYLATDFAPAVVERLARKVDPERVRVLCSAAHELQGVAPSSVDTVVLNSVVQYFPSAAYLVSVLERAVEAAAPRGRIFLGDIRSLALLDEFCLEVESRRAEAEATLFAIRERARSRRDREEELLLDPRFFEELRRIIPRVRHVRILPKRGRYDRELSYYRYDVTLGLDDGSPIPDLAAEAERVVPAPRERTGTSFANDPLRVRKERRLRERLRDFASRRLPEFMVPATFVVRDSLPLTPSGKVDRRALRIPRAQDDAPASEAPRTRVETMLARIWADVLGRRAVSVRESFFELGGHSLLAAQVVSRIRAVLGVEVELRALFERPTIELLAASLEGASARERDLVRKVEKSATYPLSFAQQRLWFLSKLAPESTAYHVSYEFLLEGALDAAALERSLRDVVLRHESLRTRFPAVGGLPVQRIDPAWASELTVIEGSAELEVPPFDLESGPLFRASLRRLSPAEQVLRLDFHHIVTDGWSMGTFFRELSVLYAAHRRGVPAALAEPRRQYVDYASWQRERLGAVALERGLAYWRDRLADIPSLDLPGLRRDRSAAGTRAALWAVSLSPETTRALRELAGRAGASAFMTLLAAFVALLHRFTSQEEIVVGCPYGNREREELEGVIGFFVNTLVLRSSVDPEESFFELLERVRARTLEDFAHSDVPFEKVVEALAPARDPLRNPLFQVLFDVHGSPPGLELDGLRCSPIETAPESPLADLSLDVWEQGEGLRLAFEYDVDRWETGMIETLAASYVRLIDSVLTSPSDSIGALALNPSVALPRVEHGLPTGALAHELFFERARESPGSLALVSEGLEISYGELAGRANRLARYLSARGAGPERIVGVFLPRSVDAVVALLAVLRAGAAYLPLDPDYPPERLRFLLRDANVPLVVTDGVRRRFLEEIGTQAAVVFLDEELEAVEAEADARPSVEVSADHLAYLLYTSGSTGIPKGVGVPHRALANHTLDARRAFDLTPSDRALQFAPLSFDTAGEEIYPTLASGATLVLRDEGMLGAPSSFIERVAELGITVLNLPTSLWHDLVGAGASFPPSVRLVIIGGEAALSERFARSRGAGLRLVNTYGATETAMVVLRADLGLTDAPEPPIGRPIANVEAYVLDPGLQPVPDGAAGELYIGGEALARGYWNHPDWTAERFVPHPFRANGSRLFRTGDRVRSLPGGDLQYLGRMDAQIKLRGHRIEPTEVENVLLEHPGVLACAVAVRRLGSTAGLVAHLVPKGTPPLSFPALRRHVAERIPAHLRPDRYVSVERLPRTPSGKIDRVRVTEIPLSEETGNEERVAPRSPLEEELAAIWRDLLGIDPGVTDDFFTVGGHSLAAVELLARLERRFGARLPLARLFEASSIESLALALLTNSRSNGRSLVALRPGGARRPVFLVHPIGGSVFAYGRLSACLNGDRPVYGLQSRGIDGDLDLDETIPAMAERYVREIESIDVEGPYCLVGWSMGGLVAFEMAQRIRRAGKHLALVGLIDIEPSGGVEPSDPSSDLDDFAEHLGLVVPRVREWLGSPRIGRLYELYRNNRAAIERYVPVAYPGSIVLFRAESSRGARDGQDGSGWERLVAKVDRVNLPGDHFSILAEPNVSRLAAEIDARLEKL